MLIVPDAIRSQALTRTRIYAKEWFKWVQMTQIDMAAACGCDLLFLSLPKSRPDTRCIVNMADDIMILTWYCLSGIMTLTWCRASLILGSVPLHSTSAAWLAPSQHFVQYPRDSLPGNKDSWETISMKSMACFAMQKSTQGRGKTLFRATSCNMQRHPRAAGVYHLGDPLDF